MSEKEPVAEPMLSSEGATVLSWEEARSRLADLGQVATHWLATVRPDGRPHVVPVGATWSNGAVYFTTGQGTRKGKNLESNPHCVISFATRGLDLVVEGRAYTVTDTATLERVAGLYRSGGWPATVRDGALDAPYSAPTTGPAPYDVYKLTPTTVYGFGTSDEMVNHPTRWRF
jgi:nitroimidazol reductase NimA-like FMN-containing flavoprotein (pyridoxamine 5'-phosphate oxidase superfamily)